MRITKYTKPIPAWFFIPVLLVAFFTLSYCTEKDNKARKSVEDLKGYVETRAEKSDSLLDEQWENIEREYEEKRAEVELHADKMESELKDSYHQTEAKWGEYKQKMQERQETRQKEKEAMLLRSSLTPAGIDADLGNVTDANIRSVYEYFFEVVENNKETYSKEQWVHINNYWQSLNDVKDRLDKTNSITKEDEKKIKGIKAKYAATKALNKPFATSEKYQ